MGRRECIAHGEKATATMQCALAPNVKRTIQAQLADIHDSEREGARQRIVAQSVMLKPIFLWLEGRGDGTSSLHWRL
jgi:hypothetical protein